MAAICHLTHARLEDPRVTPTGHSFERYAIEEWLTREQKCPLTGNVLTPDMLKPNFALTEALQELQTLEDEKAELRQKLEAELRQTLEAELRQELEAELRQELEAEYAELRQQLEAENAELKQKLQKSNAELETRREQVRAWQAHHASAPVVTGPIPRAKRRAQPPAAAAPYQPAQ